MAHFAKLDSDNIVIRVSVVDNPKILDENGNESEQVGIDYLTKLHGYSNWKQASYNGNFRKNFPGTGYRYDENLDAFIAPKPYPSWILNEETCIWEAPVPLPEDAKPEDLYGWDEELGHFVKLN